MFRLNPPATGSNCIIEPLKARICPAPVLWSPNQELLTVLSNEPVKTKTLVWLFATTGMVTAAWAYNAYTERGPRLAQAIDDCLSRPAQSLFNVFCSAVKAVIHVAVATCFLVFAVHAPALAEPGVRTKLLEPVVEFASTAAPVAAPVAASQLVLYVGMALAGLLPPIYCRSVSRLSPLARQVSEKAGATWSSVKDVAKKTRSDIKAQLTPLSTLYQRSASCVSSLAGRVSSLRRMCLHAVIAWMSVTWMCVYDAANKTRSLLKAVPSFYQRSVSCLSSHARHVCAQAAGAWTSVYDAVKLVPMQVVEQLRAAVNCLVACLLLIAALVALFMIALVIRPGSLLISLIEGLEEAYNRAVSALNVLSTWYQRRISWLSTTRGKVVDGLSTTRDKLFTTHDKVAAGLSTTRGKMIGGIATMFTLNGLLLPLLPIEVAFGSSVTWLIILHVYSKDVRSQANVKVDTVASTPLRQAGPLIRPPVERLVELYAASYAVETDWIDMYECPREFAIGYDPPCTDTSSTPALRDEEQVKLLNAANELGSYGNTQQTFIGALADFGHTLEDTKVAYESRDHKRGYRFLVDMHHIRSQYEVYSKARRLAMAMVQQLLSDPRSEDFKEKLLVLQADQDILRYEHEHSRLLDQCSDLSEDARGYHEYIIGIQPLHPQAVVQEEDRPRRLLDCSI